MSAASMRMASGPCTTSRPAAVRPVALKALPLRVHATSLQAPLIRRQVLAKASAEEVKEVALNASAAGSGQVDWVPICAPEELPKGVRKEVDVEGRQVLVFWYRNQIYAIEARSPAEGAYSEGFIRAKFTQDYCIECPSTGSLFSLKDGSIQAWYPNNPVLRALTPLDTCRNMEVYPVRLAQEAIYVDVSRSSVRNSRITSDRGGAATSLENNNVFSVQPTVYFEGMDPTKESASVYTTPMAQGQPSPLAAIGATVGVGVLAVAGTAVALYQENIAGLAAFWAVLGSIAAWVGYRYVNRNIDPADAKKQ